MPKRVCFFAGYDSRGNIAGYVEYYIKALSEVSDVYYFADCDMKKSELERLAPYVKYAGGTRHRKYDFGSWQEIAMMNGGMDAFAEYDSLILCNDSCFGPLFPLEPVFEKARAFGCDFWGITEGHKKRRHLQSYFMVLNRDVFLSEAFKNFMKSIEIADKEEVIDRYEAVFTGALEDAGFKCAKLMQGRINAYDRWRTLVKKGSPFIKRLSFTEKDRLPYRESLAGWEAYLKKFSGYDAGLIKKSLADAGMPEGYYKSSRYRLYVFRYNLKRFAKWLFDVRLGRKRAVLRLFGVYLVNRDNDTIPSFDA